MARAPGIPPAPAAVPTPSQDRRSGSPCRYTLIDTRRIRRDNAPYVCGSLPLVCRGEGHAFGTGSSAVSFNRWHKVEKKDSPAWTFYYLRWLTRCDVVTNTPQYIDLEHVFDKRWQTVCAQDEYPRLVGQVPRLGPGPVLGRSQARRLRGPRARRPSRWFDRPGELREVSRAVKV